jgi:hypothetical protein
VSVAEEIKFYIQSYIYSVTFIDLQKRKMAKPFARNPIVPVIRHQIPIRVKTIGGGFIDV